MANPDEMMRAEAEGQAMEAAQVEMQVAEGAPPPLEPFEANVLNTLQDFVYQAIDHLSDGQVELPEPTEFVGMQEEIPPQLLTPIAGVLATLEQSGSPLAEPYLFEIELLQDNAGLQQLSALFSAMSRDAKLAREIARSQPAAPPTATATDVPPPPPPGLLEE